LTPEQEHQALSWRLIEWKVAYYAGQHVHKSRKVALTVSDDTYDAHELRYLTLCRELQQPNTLVHKSYPGFSDIDTSEAMMELDYERPSVKLVIWKLQQKLTQPKRKSTCATSR
jgi:hypothetical protein